LHGLQFTAQNIGPEHWGKRDDPTPVVDECRQPVIVGPDERPADFQSPSPGNL